MNHGKSCKFGWFSRFLGIALYCVVGLVWADAPVSFYNVSSALGYVASQDLACSQYADLKNNTPVAANTNYTYDGWFLVSANTCTLRGRNPNFASQGASEFMNLGPYGFNVQSKCADGSAPDGSKPLASQCTTPPPAAPTCTAGSVETVTLKVGSVVGTGVNQRSVDNNPIPISTGLCNAEVKKVVKCYSDSKLGGALRPVYCTYEMQLDGVATPQGVAQTTPPVASPAPEPTSGNVASGKACPAGTVQTGVDSSGLVSCAGSGTAPGSAPTEKTVNPPSTVTNADGSSTTTNSTTTTNSDGSKTTTEEKTTTGTDGKKTTTTSTTTSNALGGGAGTEDKPETDFCKKNPTLTICRDSSVSGACGSLQCKGDAIQCAMYVAQVQHMCAMSQDSAVVQGNLMANTSLAGGTADDIKGVNKDGKNDIDIGKKFDAAKLDAAGKLPMFSGGGTCPAPMNLQMPITHSVVNVPFDTLCGMAGAMRGFAILAAGLVSLKIMFRNAS
jgi:hypothetical protein